MEGVAATAKSTSPTGPEEEEEESIGGREGGHGRHTGHLVAHCCPRIASCSPAQSRADFSDDDDEKRLRPRRERRCALPRTAPPLPPLVFACYSIAEWSLISCCRPFFVCICVGKVSGRFEGGSVMAVGSSSGLARRFARETPKVWILQVLPATGCPCDFITVVRRSSLCAGCVQPRSEVVVVRQF